MDLDLKLLRVNWLHIPQERMASRLGVPQQTISFHLQKMPERPYFVNTDSSKGFTVPQEAEKHACPVGPEDRTGGGRSLLSGPLRWRAKAILIGSGNLTVALRTWTRGK